VQYDSGSGPKNLSPGAPSFRGKGAREESVHIGLPWASSNGIGLGQLFLLIFGFLVTSAFIFLFGMWVGRDVAERRLAQDERVVRLPMPAPPTARAEEAETNADASFYQGLKEKAYRRLEETAAASSAVQAVVPTPTLPPPPVETPTKPPTPVIAVAKPPARAAGGPTPSPMATQPPKRPTPTPAEFTRNERAAAGWTVQVIATTSIQQAADLARRLKARGYEAYTVQSPAGGQAWYRVRVGIFSSREQAKELERKLKTVEGLESAYVTAR